MALPPPQIAAGQTQALDATGEGLVTRKLCALLLTLVIGTGAAATPDYPKVVSTEQASQLHEKGELERIYLFPLEYGGPDIPPNIVYVPLGTTERKAAADSAVVPLLESGKAVRYAAEPTYKGDSLIPSAITIKAKDGTGTVVYERRINLW